LPSLLGLIDVHLNIGKYGSGTPSAGTNYLIKNSVCGYGQVGICVGATKDGAPVGYWWHIHINDHAAVLNTTIN
jgi:hypothetical protein